MAKSSPLRFYRQVRQEVAKVTWPSRKETIITTIMVFIFVVVASFFFLLVDQVIGYAIRFVLGFGG
jgi:preprotein translocase subunit SecE